MPGFLYLPTGKMLRVYDAKVYFQVYEVVTDGSSWRLHLC